jgi:hypothetical protein
MTAPGAFSVPVKDDYGQPIQGDCCGICGPVVDAFCGGGCKDLDLLPDGPLKTYLLRVDAIRRGQRTMQLVLWLAKRESTVQFQLDKVTLTVGEDTITKPSLEEAVLAMAELEVERTVH